MKLTVDHEFLSNAEHYMEQAADKLGPCYEALVINRAAGMLRTLRLHAELNHPISVALEDDRAYRYYNVHATDEELHDWYRAIGLIK